MAPNRIIIYYVAVLLCTNMCAGHRALREPTEEKKNDDSRLHSSPISKHHRKGVVIEAVRLKQAGRVGSESRGLTVMEKYGGRTNETVIDECVQNPQSPGEKLCKKFTRHANGKVSTTDSTVKTKVWRALEDDKSVGGGNDIDETPREKNKLGSGRNKRDIGKPNRKPNSALVGHWATSVRGEKPRSSSKKENKPRGTPNLLHGKSSKNANTEESLDESSKLAFEELASASGDRTSNTRVSMNFTMGGY